MRAADANGDLYKGPGAGAADPLTLRTAGQLGEPVIHIHAQMSDAMERLANFGRRGLTDVLPVGVDPVGSYLVLGGLEVQLSGAYMVVELPLERILYKRVPRGCSGRLRPKVSNGIGSSQRQGNRVVDFVAAGFMLRDPIFGIRLSLQPGHGPHLLGRNRERTRRQSLRRMYHRA